MKITPESFALPDQSGRRWAYAGLIVGLLVSATGNVANAILVKSSAPLWLEVTFAVLWPIWTWIGIEVLIRTNWRRTLSHLLTRVSLAGLTAGVAAYASYTHLSNLMKLGGEPGLVQMLGPLAIDGTLFGCTVVLLITRKRPVLKREKPQIPMRDSESRILAEDLPIPVSPAIPAPRTPLEDSPVVPIPVSPALPFPVSPAIPAQRPSTLRGEWDVPGAVKLILEGNLNNAEIGEIVGIGRLTVQRTRRAVEAIRKDPDVEIPKDWKVPPAVIQIIRREIPR